ncbi:aldolase/citrate lyase family protein [Amycolatopsis cynarae]|uniref:Aldolase/citrate lyase family protein n=1 Tax=Amycolatopsis cynarae TaxID=2995223 RepID=A0ABY7B075_9PSEU|nr:aldolase/citrate lyase family protein [Amycolatopsis sp. HUAS 11-8]WAL64238.1 aldolase/citrate lyase family protein [Amycolatopsis sp. HUAS 11-8]
MASGRLTERTYAAADARLSEVDARVAARYPGEPAGRQPVHTVYVPASAYGPGLVADWGERAGKIFADRGGELGLAPELAVRVARKLETEPIEDLRVDFEDGYGHPGDEEEDAAALACGRTLARTAGATPFCGIRFKSFEQATRRRGIRTLDLFLAGLLETGPLPDGFVVTLPKVTAVEQVSVAADVLAELERAYGLPEGRLRFEVQIETSQSIVDADGTVAVARIVTAARGRCSGLHYGTYDYSAGLGIAAAYQSMAHPAADFAKAVMQVGAAGTGVRLSDGSTNRLPVGEAVAEAWREHLGLVRRSLERGFYQGWDLHPHQLPTRYAATYGFFREGLPAAAVRLRDYAEAADSGVLDEPATAQALAAFLCRGLDCGALDEGEMPLPRARLDAYRRRAITR